MEKINFQDLPIELTPIDSDNLNLLQQNIENEFTNIHSNIAETYSNASTYSIGDIVTYNSLTYICTTNISTPEVWTITHWSQTQLATEIVAVENRITTAETDITNLKTGWLPANETWTYASVDDPTGNITISGDKTTKYSTGMRIKFTNGGNIIYGIITKLVYSSPNTTLTFLHEINPSNSQALHLMANSAITNNYYSSAKAPYGFPMSEDKWAIKFTDATLRALGTPTTNTWYNLSSLQKSVPIGAYKVKWKIMSFFERVSTGPNSLYTCISTSPNSASNSEYITSQAGYGTNNANFGFTTVREEYIEFASKTTIYFNIMTADSAVGIYFQNNQSTLLFKATCAYL